MYENEYTPDIILTAGLHSIVINRIWDVKYAPFIEDIYRQYCVD